MGFNLPNFDTENIWGPPSQVPDNMQFKDAPYAPFSKGDKLGKAADWAADATKEGKDQKRTQHGRGFRDPYHAYGASSSSFFANDEADASWSFSVVDSTGKAIYSKPNKTFNAVLKTRGRSNGAPAPRASSAPAQGAPSSNNRNSTRPSGQQSNQPRDFRSGGRRQGGAWQNDKARNREPSVTIKPDWTFVQSNNFSELQKLSYDVKPGTTIARYGYVHVFDKVKEKNTAPTRLRPVDNTVYNVTTSDDPVIQKLAAENTGKVYATDAIIALLMTAPKSNIPWDVIINKTEKGIFLDKREGGPLDFLTVDENSSNPPQEQPASAPDSATSLGIEATYINQNFIANAVTSEVVNLEHANPFVEAGSSEPLLAKGYIYKSFNLEADPEAEPVNLVIRTEVDAAVEDGAETSFVTVRALNEHGSSKPLEWRERFNNHRGAIVTDEMKNNINKLAQWTVQALLADCKTLKIGFVSRVNAKERTQHDIIGVLNRNPIQFASNLSLNMNNAWGIIKSLVNIATELENGKYMVLRDPNHPALKFFSIPENTTFDSE